MDNRNAAILNEVKKVIVGKDDVLQKVLMTILAGGHVLLEDVPGTGKTTLALAFSKAMNLAYNRVQFTPDTMASDVIGFSVYNKDSGDFEYRRGAIICNFFLGDEINRTSAKTQAALLQAMEELKVTVDGKTYKLPDPFVCVATQNPLGSAGTHNLPDSQLDRFMVRLSMGYPSTMETLEIVRSREKTVPLDSVRPVVTREEIRAMKDAVCDVYIADEVVLYASELCEKTREHADIEQGVSPRAVLALVQLAKARAYLAGRNYVAPQDIQALYADVCGHRIILTPRAKIKKRAPAEILGEIMKTVHTPNPADK
ncbi:MAG: MoxR family ATPase [Eubacteriales bacterium]|nr:MoxR family ATPase [Eubacteriales bacterium]